MNNITILVCGGRDYHDRNLLFKVLDKLKPTTIIHGAARGADTLANDWAISRKVNVIEYPANWNKYGKSAGPVRNRQMLNTNPDIIVAFPGGRGTAHMIKIAQKQGIETIII